MPFATEPLPNMSDIRDYNRVSNLTPWRDMQQKYFADLKRVCEVEDTVVEWFEFAHVNTPSLSSHMRRQLDIEQF